MSVWGTEPEEPMDSFMGVYRVQKITRSKAGKTTIRLPKLNLWRKFSSLPAVVEFLDLCSEERGIILFVTMIIVATIWILLYAIEKSIYP